MLVERFSAGLLICISLAALGVLFLPMPDAAMAQAPLAGLTFGSEKVLRSCWSAEELQGKPEDKVIIFDRDMVSLPPRLTAPEGELCPSRPVPSKSVRHIIPIDNKKVIALTFDLCERADEITGYDYEIVNYLRAHQIKATFFAGGKWMQSHPDKTMQLMADPLFEIGNHTWSHANMRVIGKEEQRQQVLLTQAQYRELRRKLACWPCAKQAGMKEIAKIPEIPLCFRFPFGTCNTESLRLLKQMNLIAVQWNDLADDSEKGQTTERIAENVLRNVRPGAIIICHANGRGHETAQAMAIFVPELQKQGYVFVTVSELLTFGPVFAASGCYELTPGDNKRYDQLFGNGSELPKKQGEAARPQ
jgi:peptidoglycan/xylan/chitin deacetylase (PgdA/CDA1 family)